MTIAAILAGAGLVSALCAVLALEGLLRRRGFLDFPLYDASSVVGYVPRPNTRGRLLNRADWAFNALSMGVAEPFAPEPQSVLLIGDILVFTGAQVPQARKLGPMLQARLNRPIWPISAPSWAFSNELAWLEAHPEALTCETLVVVLNTGDFQYPSVWRDPYQHPRRRPVSAIWYLARKKYNKPVLPPRTAPTPEEEARWADQLERLLAAHKGRLIFVLYPDKPELLTGEDRFDPFRRRLAGRAEVFDLRPHWKVEYFKDSMHPTDETYPLFADLLAEAIRGERRAA